MKKNILLLVFLVAGITFGRNEKTYATGSFPAGPESIEGVYQTDFNEMILYLNGNRVTGTYKHRNGKVEGILSGNKLVGTWTQDNGKGRMVFVFSSDFSSFTGKWGYNESEPGSKWNGTKIKSFNSGSSSPSATASSSHAIEGNYTTDFKDMTLIISGNHVTGSYAHMGGKIDGTLSGHKLVGIWTQTNGKGKFEFEFSGDFSSFKGKWGYNDELPTRKWDGKKSGSSGGVTSATENNLPIDIAGSWSSGGSRNQIARIHIWQNGNEFVVIACWPDETTGKWKSYRGEGRFEGRQMNFKIFPSTTDGSSADQGYVNHYTISPDNSEITGYYTRNGKRTVNTDVHYKLVK